MPNQNPDEPLVDPSEVPAPAAESSQVLAVRPGKERPLMVYFVLLAGIATLVGLIVIVWISATGGGSDERPICTEITAQASIDAIMSGEVERLNVLVDRENPLSSLTGIVLDFNDGSCRQTSQGADIRDELYMVVGAAEFYNNFAEMAVRIQYQQQDIDPSLLVTTTPTPTITPTIDPTLESTASTETPVPEITPTATALPPTPTAEPAASATVGA